MPSRPHYEVYQTQMLKKLHGFPQFAADPEGNGTLQVTEGVGKIEIGDLGYFREGRFERIIGLDLETICGPELRFNTVSIPMDSPECAGNIDMTELNTGVPITPGAWPAIPFEGGPNIRLKCVKGEGAILNVQSGKAIYKHCDATSKILLGEHMLKNYKQWLSDLRHAWYLEPEQLFLVTGTYMTHNWEAATFHTDADASVGFDVTVDAVLLEGKMSIDWTTWRNGERGFRHGHIHTGQLYPRHNAAPSFEACCNSCTEPPENQCIFLRGWRVKEFDLVKSPPGNRTSVQSTEREEMRMKRGLGLLTSVSTTRTMGSEADKRAQQDDASLGLDPHPDLMETDGTPIPTGSADIYDFVATTKFQSHPQEAIVLHDDEVIEFFSGLGTVLHEDSEERQMDPKSAVSYVSDLLIRKGEIEQELRIRNDLNCELAEIDAIIEKIQAKETPGQSIPPSPSKVGSAISSRHEEPVQEPGSSTPSQPGTPTTSSTPTSVYTQSHEVLSVDQQFHEFQWKMSTLCGEFYSAAAKLVEDAPSEVISRCYRLQDTRSINPLSILNEAKKTCDILLQQTSSLPPRPSSAGQPSSPAASGSRSILTVTPVESSSPKRSIHSLTLSPQSQTQIDQNQAPWTDQDDKPPGYETDGQKVAAEFGPTQSNHRVLVKSTSPGFKFLSIKPSPGPHDPDITATGPMVVGALRSPSHSASAPGALTLNTSMAPIHSQTTPPTPTKPLEMPISPVYPSYPVINPGHTSPPSGNLYDRERPDPQGQNTQPQMLYNVTLVPEDPHHNPFVWTQEWSPIEDGHMEMPEWSPIEDGQMETQEWSPIEGGQYQWPTDPDSERQPMDADDLVPRDLNN